MSDILHAATMFGKYVAVELFEHDEAESILLRRAVELTADSDALLNLERAIAERLSESTIAHELAIVGRVRSAIAPLIGCRACTAAILAQAHHANRLKGRLHALSDSKISELVRDELAAAVARMKAVRRA